MKTRNGPALENAITLPKFAENGIQFPLDHRIALARNGAPLVFENATIRVTAPFPSALNQRSMQRTRSQQGMCRSRLQVLIQQFQLLKHLSHRADGVHAFLRPAAMRCDTFCRHFEPGEALCERCKPSDWWVQSPDAKSKGHSRGQFFKKCCVPRLKSSSSTTAARTTSPRVALPVLMDCDQSRSGGRNSRLHVQRATSEDLAVFFKSFERRGHPFNADRVEVSIEQKTRSRTCAANASHDVEAVRANFFQTGNDSLRLQHRQQIFGNTPLTRASCNQGWVYRLDLDERFENAETALEGGLKCHRCRVYGTHGGAVNHL